MLLAFLGAAVPMVVGVWRTLPRAYGVYVLAALALPLSYPVASQPLMSLPRFLVVLFPLSIWLGAWLAAHPRARVPGARGLGAADGVLRRPVRDLALGGVSAAAICPRRFRFRPRRFAALERRIRRRPESRPGRTPGEPRAPAT